MALTDNLIAYWEFNENSGTNLPDVTPQSHDGTLQNMEDGDWNANGILGNCLEFGGTNEYVTVADNADLDVSALTISCWVWDSSFNDSNLLDRIYTAGSGHGYMLSYLAGKVRFTVTTSAGSELILSNGALSTSAWHHIVGTWDGSNMALWVDGVEQTDTDALAGTITSDKIIELGRAGDSSWYLTGRLDEIGMWGRAITDSEIGKLYNSGSGLAYADFDAAVPPVAGFSATPLAINENETVTFTDSSTNTPTSWAWTFGDNKTSALQNPTHDYTDKGFYTVTLTATNAEGSDDETKTNYIQVSYKHPGIAGSRGTKEINKNYPDPSDTGLEPTNYHVGRTTNLVAEGINGLKTIVSKKERNLL